MASSIFDSNKNEITILVHTESILKDPDTIDFLLTANKLSAISILFMPVINPQSEIPFQTGKYTYEFSEKTVTLSLVFSKVTVFRACFNKNLYQLSELEKIAETCILNGNFSSPHIDYILSDQIKTPPINGSKIQIVSVKQCREILRLFLVNTKQYSVSERYTIDETLYYLYKHKAIFCEFQNYWNAVYKDKEISDWADALGKRLELLAVCLDKCLIETYKEQNNCTAMYLQYHVGYLILLMTSTYDNLAWLINIQYKLEIDNKYDVDLKKRDFLKRIKDHSSSIHSLLSNKLFIAELDVIRELRDKIVHRQYIQTGVGVDMLHKSKTCYLHIKQSIYTSLLKAKFVSQEKVLLAGEDAFIPIRSVIYFLRNVITKNVNQILKKITSEQYETKDNILIWKLFSFPCEPYVL